MSPSPLGVVVVTFNAADVIFDCLESLLASQGVALRIVVVDNASSDGTVQALRDWAAGAIPYSVPSDMPFAFGPQPKPITLDGTPQGRADHSITLIETGVNGGFAFGVNAGLAELAKDTSIDRFWVLNPDSAVPPETPAAFAAHPAGDFSLMGGRSLYYDDPEVIQIDGGTVNRKTGITGNLGLGQKHTQTPPSDIAAMDFITGASMLASRAFYETVGPMPEDYFLYYEEVDWVLKRGALPLAHCAGGVIYHKAGTSIGSATLKRPASPFSQYFKHRARLLFVRRYFPKSLPIALAYSVAKSAQLLLKGYPREAGALMRGSFGLGPSAKVRDMLSPEAAKLALAKPEARG